MRASKIRGPSLQVALEQVVFRILETPLWKRPRYEDSAEVYEGVMGGDRLKL